jgi:hypothetical protein
MYQACWLNDKNIGSPNIFTDLKIKFAVGETICAGHPQITTQITADLIGQLLMCIASKNFDIAGYAHCLLQNKQMTSNIELVSSCPSNCF